MLAALMFVGLAAQQLDKANVATYLHAHREADRALTAGKNVEARAGFEKCLEFAPKNATVAYGLACARAKSGEKDAALEWLARAIEWGYADAELALWDTDLASLRDDERFKSAIEAMRKLAAESVTRKLSGAYDKRAQFPIDVAIDRSGRRIAVGYHDGDLAMLDGRSGDEIGRRTNLGGKVWAVAMHPKGQRIFALTYDGKIHFWSPDDTAPPSSGQALSEPEKKDGWPFGALLAIDPSGERLLVGGREHGASLWTSSGTLIRKLDANFGGFFEVALAWNSDGSRIAHWHGNTITFFDGKTGESIDASITTPSNTECVGFDRSGKLLASGHEDGCVRLWDAKTLELVRKCEPLVDPLEAGYYVAALQFAPDGDRLAYTTGTGVFARVVETATCKELWMSEHLGGRMGEPVHICWAPDGRRFWTAYVSGVMNLMHVEVGESYHAELVVRSGLPEASDGGIAVFKTFNAVNALDTKSGRLLWSRVSIGKDGVLFHTPDGWFDANFDDLGDMTLHRPAEEEQGMPMKSLARLLFDPKRVRAAKAGVVLALVK